jgi:hypothetical protein
VGRHTSCWQLSRDTYTTCSLFIYTWNIVLHQNKYREVWTKHRIHSHNTCQNLILMSSFAGQMFSRLLLWIQELNYSTTYQIKLGNWKKFSISGGNSDPFYYTIHTVFTRIKYDPAYKTTPLHNLQFSGRYQYSHLSGFYVTHCLHI